jgi:RNA polymerase sigma-70 factor (ECF subfamily)
MEFGPDTRPSLLVRLRDARDEEAWAEFISLYGPLVERLVRRRRMQEADARELVQEVLARVARTVERWDPSRERGSFRGWLRRVVRNLTIDFLQDEQRRPRGAGASAVQRRLDDEPDRSLDEATAEYDLEYRRQLLRRAAELVRPSFRPATFQAFWRTCVDGEAIAAVATELAMTEGAVYVARCRVLARLKQQAAALDDEEGTR